MARIMVTGAFSNIGASAAEELARSGAEVVTLTNREPQGPLSGIETHALRFDEDHLADALSGTDVLVNTYWVRTPLHGASFDEGMRNSHTLLDAAHRAGVRRVVQVSVLHADPSSPSPYYAGKGVIDDYVRSRFDDYAIVAPSLVLGTKDVLTSNMAWFVRRMPVVPVPSGDCELQPVLLDDLGELVAKYASTNESMQRTTEAIGPERYSFREYLELIATAAGLRRRFVPVPVPVFAGGTWVAGRVLRDDLVTRDELQSLRSGYLLPVGEATCGGSVAAWLQENVGVLGRRYVNDAVVRRESARRARA